MRLNDARVREDFEPITIDDDRGRIRRTDLDRLPLPRAPLPPLGLSPNFGDLSEALESAALLRERLFRNDRRSVDELFESMNRAERRERLGQDVDRRGRR